MLDQLVESKSNAGVNTRRSEFMLVTLVIIVAALIGTWTYSLFAKDYGMGTGDLGLSELLPPVALPEDAPPPPEPPKPDKSPATDKVIVKDLTATMDRTTEPPKETLGKAKTVGLPPDVDLSKVKVGNNPSGNIADIPRGGTGSGTGIGGGGGGGGDDDDEPPPPKPKPTKPISGGVLNGKAVNLVKPPYPAAARAVRASGAVNVQVIIDESGRVTSATATSGHPLLRAAAVQAAQQSKFSPTMLSGQPVKVSGVIVYNFMP
jgi:protein TonB